MSAALGIPALDRVVEILVPPDGEGDWGYGSGYNVAPGIVLTAHHVVDDAATALVRFKGGRPGEYETEATVIWRPQRRDPDLALLSLTPVDAALAPVTFGDPERAGGELPFRAIGFPIFKRIARDDGAYLRDSQQIDGSIALGSNIKTGRLTLQTSAQAPPPLVDDQSGEGRSSQWEGMSGAAVFSGTSLVGVVVVHRKPEGDANLTGVRIADVTDPHLLGQREGDRFWELLGAPGLKWRLPVLAPPERAGDRAGMGAWLPRTPAHALERTFKLHAILDLLSAEDSPGRRVALAGMGGCGKSVLAAQLARHPDDRRTFPDGVIWLEFDDTPLVQLQARLAAALDDPGRTFADWIQGRQHLTELLRPRLCLLILDNVTTRNDLDAFEVLDGGSSLLFTTRDVDLATAYADADGVHEVELLAPEEARALLADWVGMEPTALPPRAADVLERCAGLPLAIAMAGAMARGRADRWDQLVRKLDAADTARIAAHLPGYPHANLLAALEAGIRDLDEAGSERGLRSALDRYLELAVFKGRGPVPPSPLAALWSRHDVSEEHVADYAELFVGRSLAFRTGTELISLHDLQMTYIASRVGGRATGFHAALVDGYAMQCPAGWASGPDDAYYFRNLPEHLAAAGRTGQLRELLADAAWLRSKLRSAGPAALVADYKLVRATVPSKPSLRR